MTSEMLKRNQTTSQTTLESSQRSDHPSITPVHSLNSRVHSSDLLSNECNNTSETRFRLRRDSQLPLIGVPGSRVGNVALLARVPVDGNGNTKEANAPAASNMAGKLGDRVTREFDFEGEV